MYVDNTRVHSQSTLNQQWMLKYLSATARNGSWKHHRFGKFNDSSSLIWAIFCHLIQYGLDICLCLMIITMFGSEVGASEWCPRDFGWGDYCQNIINFFFRPEEKWPWWISWSFYLLTWRMGSEDLVISWFFITPVKTHGPLIFGHIYRGVIWLHL